MFKDKNFGRILETLQTAPKEDVPIAAFLEVDGVAYRGFTNEVYQCGSHLNHAEILAINHVLKELKIMDFKNHKAILYSSLEPCCMCLAFSSLVRISQIVYYAEDLKFGGVGRIYTLNSSFTKPDFLFIEKDEVKKLMGDFFKNKR